MIINFPCIKVFTLLVDYKNLLLISDKNEENKETEKQIQAEEEAEEQRKINNFVKNVTNLKYSKEGLKSSFEL